ncbi:uncharacterized protein LOC111865025 [Cryptotermes secundus]|uniref:uncharacterized protein LOC111865025 n=1 Tax=Cryptotermes secundus TaxID=105785 RepID=UPI001454DC7D|nr:uncharacterized protein LOC111865025 [Cryptotermes secundus]
MQKRKSENTQDCNVKGVLKLRHPRCVFHSSAPRQYRATAAATDRWQWQIHPRWNQGSLHRYTNTNSKQQVRNMFTAVSAVFIVEKMLTLQESTQTGAWFCETKLVTQTQRNFRTHYQKDLPSRNSIIDWKKKFLETGSVLSKKSSGRPSTSNDDAERVQKAFARSPRKSLRTAARELNMPLSTVH